MKELATELGDERWRNRALAQIGVTAFYDRDLETAAKNVGTAAARAKELHDIGGDIRFTCELLKPGDILRLTDLPSDSVVKEDDPILRAVVTGEYPKALRWEHDKHDYSPSKLG